MSAGDYGTHLLGRKPMPRDDRDYQLGDFLQAHAQLDDALTPTTTLAELKSLGPLETWHEVYAFWAWFKKNIINPPAPTPTPTPTPPGAEQKLWQHGPISDQGNTGHCVGFTGLDWGNAMPIDDQWPNQKGHDIYYACKILDGEPQAEDGSNSRSLCKVLKDMGRIGAYAFAANAEEAATYILNHGPVGIGVDWYNDMFNPQAPHFILSPTGGIAGGHEISLIGYDNSSQLFTLLNHWGAGWAGNGVAYLHASDLDQLLRDGGDCWAGLENPV